MSQGLRNPIDTFTVSGSGCPGSASSRPWTTGSPSSRPRSLGARSRTAPSCRSGRPCSPRPRVPAAYALARFRFRRIPNIDITIWFLSQRVLPPVATVIPFYLVMRALGLLDTQLAPHPRQRDLRPAVRGRDPPPDLPRSPARARGGGPRRRGAPTGPPSPGSPSPSPRPASRRPRSSRSPSPGTSSSSRSPSRAGTASPSRSSSRARWTPAASSSGFMAVRALMAMIPPVLIAPPRPALHRARPHPGGRSRAEPVRSRSAGLPGARASCPRQTAPAH